MQKRHIARLPAGTLAIVLLASVPSDAWSQTTLYGVTRSADLYTIDVNDVTNPQNGPIVTATLVRHLTVPGTPAGLAADPALGELYVLAQPTAPGAAQLFSVDPSPNGQDRLRLVP